MKTIKKLNGVIHSVSLRDNNSVYLETSLFIIDENGVKTLTNGYDFSIPNVNKPIKEGDEITIYPAKSGSINGFLAVDVNRQKVWYCQGFVDLLSEELLEEKSIGTVIQQKEKIMREYNLSFDELWELTLLLARSKNRPL